MIVTVVRAKAQRRRPLSQFAPAGSQPRARSRFTKQPYCSRLDVIAQSPTRRVKGTMIREIGSRVALKLADQHGECDEGVVRRIFISQPLSRLSSRRRMRSLQRVQYIVAKHDITAIGKNVELHGGGSEKWVARIRQISPFDGAAEHPAVFAFSGFIRPRGSYSRPARIVRCPAGSCRIQISRCDGNVFRGGSAATAVAAEPAARTTDASSTCERFFMMLLPSGLTVLIQGVAGVLLRNCRCGSTQLPDDH